MAEKLYIAEEFGSTGTFICFTEDCLLHVVTHQHLPESDIIIDRDTIRIVSDGDDCPDIATCPELRHKVANTTPSVHRTTMSSPTKRVMNITRPPGFTASAQEGLEDGNDSQSDSDCSFMSCDDAVDEAIADKDVLNEIIAMTRDGKSPEEIVERLNVEKELVDTIMLNVLFPSNKLKKPGSQGKLLMETPSGLFPRTEGRLGGVVIDSPVSIGGPKMTSEERRGYKIGSSSSSSIGGAAPPQARRLPTCDHHIEEPSENFYRCSQGCVMSSEDAKRILRQRQQRIIDSCQHNISEISQGYFRCSRNCGISSGDAKQIRDRERQRIIDSCQHNISEIYQGYFGCRNCGISSGDAKQRLWFIRRDRERQSCQHDVEQNFIPGPRGGRESYRCKKKGCNLSDQEAKQIWEREQQRVRDSCQHDVEQNLIPGPRGGRESYRCKKGCDLSDQDAKQIWEREQQRTCEHKWEFLGANDLIRCTLCNKYDTGH